MISKRKRNLFLWYALLNQKVMVYFYRATASASCLIFYISMHDSSQQFENKARKRVGSVLTEIIPVGISLVTASIEKKLLKAK